MQAGIQISCNEAQSIQRSLDVWNESREANGYFEIPFVSEATLSTHCRDSVIDLGFLKPVIRDRLHISKRSRNTYMNRITLMETSYMFLFGIACTRYKKRHI